MPNEWSPLNVCTFLELNRYQVFESNLYSVLRCVISGFIRFSKFLLNMITNNSDL